MMLITKKHNCADLPLIGSPDNTQKDVYGPNSSLSLLESAIIDPNTSGDDLENDKAFAINIATGLSPSPPLYPRLLTVSHRPSSATHLKTFSRIQQSKHTAGEAKLLMVKCCPKEEAARTKKKYPQEHFVKLQEASFSSGDEM